MDLLVIICCVAALSLGSTFLAPYYLATVTTLMLLVRCVQTNNKNKRYPYPADDTIEANLISTYRKYGLAWEEYCRNVKSNIIPFVY